MNDKMHEPEGVEGDDRPAASLLSEFEDMGSERQNCMRRSSSEVMAGMPFLLLALFKSSRLSRRGEPFFVRLMKPEKERSARVAELPVEALRAFAAAPPPPATPNGPACLRHHSLDAKAKNQIILSIFSRRL